MRNLYQIYLSLIMGIILLGPVAPLSASDNLMYVTGPCNLKFPEDHGPHENYRTEWWYYTGNVSDQTGLAFGFQLTFFRYRIGDGTNESNENGFKTSAWRSSQLILAHAALSDINAKKHHQAEIMARQALDIAGAVQENDKTKVFIKNWSLEMMPQQHRLEADSRDFSFKFTMMPMKNPVLHGDQGYSRKGQKVES